MPKKKQNLDEDLGEELETEAEENPNDKGKEPEKIKLDWDMDPSERLKAETEALAQNDQMRAVGNYLLAEFAKDEPLAACYKARKVSLKQIIDFITKEARKAAVNNCAMIEDSTVYGWAVHFVRDGEVKETSESLTVKLFTKQVEERIKAKAEKDFYESEMRRLENEKLKAEEKERKAAERKAKREAEKAEKHKKEVGYEQMSLFEFMAPGGEA